MQHNVYTHTLDNGLTILVSPQHSIPKVSMQLWYDVGAKDEQSGQRGIAHYIEHMIFKGTNNLSESEINSIVHKLSGSCNAFTSHDYTGYMFEMPSQHWHKVLPIMAECMQYCTFNTDQLASELRAILQEMRMYRDDYTTTALEQLTQRIFIDHPYHYPIIGYQNELINLDQETITSFYNRFYQPNNATLVIVGDTTVEQAVDYAQQAFGHIPRGHVEHNRNWTHQSDISSYTVTLYRDVQQPTVMLTWEVPGFQAQQNYIWDIISWVLGAGKGSRLYKRLMTDQDLVTDIQTFVYDLFEHGQFVVYLQPRNIEDIQTISNIVMEEITACARGEVTDREIERAQRKTQMDYVSVFEDPERHAYLLGKFYLATGDENALYQYSNYTGDIKSAISQIASDYLRASVMHSTQILPIAEPDKAYFAQMQRDIDEQDTQALEHCARTSDIEADKCVLEIEPEPIKHFDFPKPNVGQLSNGLRVLYYDMPDIDKVEMILDFKAKHFYDPEDKQGRYLFMTELLQEGTQNYTANQLAQEIEDYGMSLQIAPGTIQITALPQDIERGLEILAEIVLRATFDEDAMERVRNRLLSDLDRFWDSPAQCANQVLRDAVYHDHPYHKNVLGTRETISHIQRDDILQAYAEYIVPDQSRISVVGNISDIDIQKVLEDTLKDWTGDAVPDITLPDINPPQARSIDHYINRDQTVLCYGGLSVTRHDKDFDLLLLFDQNFTGGVLDGMNSQLFVLREQSGLFYAAGGSLLAGAGNGPGMILIKSIVSNDRLDQAQEQIEALINDGAQAYTDEAHAESQRAIINTLSDHFATQQQTAQTFVSLDRLGLPFDHFDTRADNISAITPEAVREAASRYLDMQHMITLRVGRIT